MVQGTLCLDLVEFGEAVFGGKVTKQVRVMFGQNVSGTSLTSHPLNLLNEKDRPLEGFNDLHTQLTLRLSKQPSSTRLHVETGPSTHDVGFSGFFGGP